MRNTGEIEISKARLSIRTSLLMRAGKITLDRYQLRIVGISEAVSEMAACREIEVSRDGRKTVIKQLIIVRGSECHSPKPESM